MRLDVGRRGRGRREGELQVGQNLRGKHKNEFLYRGLRWEISGDGDGKCRVRNGALRKVWGG